MIKNKNQFISVDDRLPDNREDDYLVYAKEPAFKHTTWHVWIAPWKIIVRNEYGWYGNLLEKITHWMPIPKLEEDDMTYDDDYYEEDEDTDCKRCNCATTVPYDLEPTDFCNLCAQELVIKFREVLEKISKCKIYPGDHPNTLQDMATDVLKEMDHE